MNLKMCNSDLLACATGISSAAIIFVLLVFDGVRVSAANDVLLAAALTTNLLGFGMAVIERSKRLMIASGLFSIALVYAVLWGVLECFCIGGGCNFRFENCSGTRTPYIGLFNAVVLSFQRMRIFTVTAVFVLIALPALAWYVAADQSRAIQNATADVDFQESCLVQLEDLNYDGLPELEEARLIDNVTNIQLEIFKGEELPRFILITDEKLLIWKFAKKEFQMMNRFVQERRAAVFWHYCKLDLGRT